MTAVAVLTCILGGGVVGAIFKSIMDLIINRLNRKDAVEDRKDSITAAITRLETKFDHKFDHLEGKIDETTIIQCRVRILRFADEISHQVKHSESHYDQVLDDIKNYEEYCDSHPNFKNGKTGNAIPVIQSMYQERLQKGDWL